MSVSEPVVRVSESVRWCFRSNGVPTGSRLERFQKYLEDGSDVMYAIVAIDGYVICCYLVFRESRDFLRVKSLVEGLLGVDVSLSVARCRHCDYVGFFGGRHHSPAR